MGRCNMMLHFQMPEPTPPSSHTNSFGQGSPLQAPFNIKPNTTAPVVATKQELPHNSNQISHK